MSGRFSRSKGRRGEQQLVLHLANKGYKAERILNQAHTAGLPDVKAVKGKRSYTFELKTYREEFKTVYQYYYNRITPEDRVVGCYLEDSGLRCEMSTSLEDLINCSIHFFANGPEQSRLYKKLAGMNQKRGQADFLVVKDNGKPFLFLRYWGI